jgi:hypothetical protein
MANLFVTYDLYAPAKNYSRIEAAIKSLGAAGRIMLSVWYVKSALSAEAARNVLMSAIDSNDRLLVIDANNAAAVRIDATHWNALQQLWPRAA